MWAALLGKHRMDACCCTIGAAWGTACAGVPRARVPGFHQPVSPGAGLLPAGLPVGPPFYKGAFWACESGWRMGRGAECGQRPGGGKQV